jgi:hypothetical protein
LEKRFLTDFLSPRIVPKNAFAGNNLERKEINKVRPKADLFAEPVGSRLRSMRLFA